MKNTENWLTKVREDVELRPIQRAVLNKTIKYQQLANFMIKTKDFITEKDELAAILNTPTINQMEPIQVY